MTNDFREQAGHERCAETVDEASAAFYDIMAERAASKALKKKEAEKGMTEYLKAQDAFNANRERLKAERLAREAASGGMEPDQNDGTVLLF